MAFSNHDVVPDSPVNNYAVLNSNDSYNSSILSEGNLKLIGANAYVGATASIGVNSGKWYFEVYKYYTTGSSGTTAVNVGSTSGMLGFIELDENKWSTGLRGHLQFHQTSGADLSNFQNSNVIGLSDTGHVRNGDYSTATNGSTTYNFPSHTATVVGFTLTWIASCSLQNILQRCY